MGGVIGFVATTEFNAGVGWRVVSGGENGGLLAQGRIGIEGVSRLPLAHHVDHLDAEKDDGCGGRRFEAQHRPDLALDAPMVLLDPVIEVAALPDPDRLQSLAQ